MSMKIRILGTAAAEGIPAIGCDCSICKTARERGGKNIRSRSGALVNDDLKIDFGPDTLYHIHRNQLDPTLWQWLLFTHSHHDHCAHEELQYLLPGFAPEKTHQQLKMFSNACVQTKIESVEHYAGYRLSTTLIQAFEPLMLGPYQITPVDANHTDGEDCLLFVIESEGRRLFYASDTGWLPDTTWDYLAGKSLDLLVLECTKAFIEAEYTKHLSFTECLQVCERLREIGAIRDDSQIVFTHFSHNGNALHEEMEAAMNPHGIQIAYDGMVIEA